MSSALAVRIEDIDYAGRSRKDLGDVASLAESIERVGLLHPVVVTADRKLIVGRRRIEAFRRLGRKEIPARIVSNLDELSLLLQAERDENTCRKEFTPEEAVHLGKRIEKEFKPKAQERKRSGGGDKTSEKGRALRVNYPKRSQDESKRTLSQAADASGMGRSSYERAKKVVESGDRALIDEMNRTGKVNSAHNKLKQKIKLEELEKKAAEASFLKDAPEWTIFRGDVMDGLQSIVDHQPKARLIFADPPYNIGVDYGCGAKADSLPAAKYELWFREWLALAVECLTDDGSLWLMIGDEYAAEYCLAIKSLSLTVRSWVKWYETFGVNCSRSFNRTSRHIFHAVKDPRSFVFNEHAVTRPSDRQTKYNDKRASESGKLLDDVWTHIPRLTGTCDERIPSFPTQLPIKLVQTIVECASEPGDFVVDPFLGSGTTGVACLKTQRKFFGVERQDKFATIAEKRMRAAL